VLKENPGISRKDLSEKADVLYVAAGNSANVKESAWCVGYVIQVGKALGILTMDDDNGLTVTV
jgi:hypothetical protein